MLCSFFELEHVFAIPVGKAVHGKGTWGRG